MHSKNKSRSNSRTSTASSEGEPVAAATVKDENEYPSISIAPKEPTIKKKTPTNVSPKEEDTEPESALTEWEEMNMTESEFNDMIQRVRLQYHTDMKRYYEEYLLDELDSPSYWRRQIETLERQREYFNKKCGWTAVDIASVEHIDAEMKEYEKELARLEDCPVY